MFLIPINALWSTRKERSIVSACRSIALRVLNAAQTPPIPTTTKTKLKNQPVLSIQSLVTDTEGSSRTLMACSVFGGAGLLGIVFSPIDFSVECSGEESGGTGCLCWAVFLSV